MTWRALLLGLAIGFGLGWLVGGLREGPEPGVPSPLERADEAEDVALRGASAATQPSKGPAPAAEADPSLFATGTGVQVLTAARDEEVVITDEIVAVALARLDEARAAGDWTLFRGLLETLGRADTPAADAKLVAVLGDESISFPTRMGAAFRDWLAGSEVPGIADAARSRLLQNIAEGSTSWVAWHGWVDLVAEHGTEDLIRWMLLESESPDQDLREAGAEAVARSRNPAAIAWMRDALVLPSAERGFRAGHGAYPRVLRAFVEAHGEEAFDTVARIVDAELAGASVVTNMQTNVLFDLYGRTVPQERAAEAAGLLQGLATEKERVDAVKAVLAMRRRGLDVSGLDRILDAPLEALRRMADGEARGGPGTADPYAALYAVEYNRALWSEEAARALETAGRALAGRTSAASDMLELAQEIRAALRSPWRAE